MEGDDLPQTMQGQDDVGLPGGELTLHGGGKIDDNQSSFDVPSSGYYSRSLSCPSQDIPHSLGTQRRRTSSVRGRPELNSLDGACKFDSDISLDITDDLKSVKTPSTDDELRALQQENTELKEKLKNRLTTDQAQAMMNDERKTLMNQVQAMIKAEREALMNLIPDMIAEALLNAQKNELPDNTAEVKKATRKIKTLERHMANDKQATSRNFQELRDNIRGTQIKANQLDNFYMTKFEVQKDNTVYDCRGVIDDRMLSLTGSMNGQLAAFGGELTSIKKDIIDSSERMECIENRVKATEDHNGNLEKSFEELKESVDKKENAEN